MLWLSTGPGGELASLGSGEPSFSEDGRTIVFHSSSPNLVENDRNNGSDVFVARLPDSDFTLRIHAFHMSSPGELVIQASAIPGKMYQLQHSATLTDGAWINLGIAEAASENTITLRAAPSAEPAGFYRVRT